MKKIFISLLLLAAVSCADEPYVIVQVADSQLGFTAKARAQSEGTSYENDLTYELDCLSRAIAKINELDPDAVIFTGDQVHHPGNPVEWEAFNNEIASIDKDIDVYHIPGNHDVIISKNHVDLTPFAERFGEGNFVSVDRKVRLVGVNSNIIKYDDPREQEQKQWLEHALQKERRGEVTLVFSHHPFFLKEVGEKDGYFQIQSAKRQGYMDIFKSMNVDALYAGHLHNNSEGSYEGIPVRTTTSVGYQIGDAYPSVRVITITDGKVIDSLLPIE